MRTCPACPRRGGTITQCSSCEAIDARRREAEERISQETARDGSIPGLEHIAPKIPPGKVRGASASPVTQAEADAFVKDLIDLPCGARVTAAEAYSHELCPKCMKEGSDA